MKPWRSLDEWEGNEVYRRWADHEFPPGGPGDTDRRTFLKVLGASLAAAGLVSCRRPDTRLVPYGELPPEVVPGQPLYYASTFVRSGRVTGVLAETHVGRPIKLEGNPLHRLSGGKLDAFGQAAVLDLYDPDRSKGGRKADGSADWEGDVLPLLRSLRERHRADRGAGLAILSGRNVSPAVEMLRSRIRTSMPAVSFCEWEPLAAEAASFEADYVLDEAAVILTLDADILGLEDDGVRHKRGWSRGRGGRPGDAMNRVYTVEPHLTVTGMSADHRLVLPAAGLDLEHPFIAAALKDVGRAGERGVVVAGERQPTWVHAAARRINEENGSRCVSYRARRTDLVSLTDLVKRPIDTLIVVDANPVLTAPADIGFGQWLAGIDTSLHLGTYHDETGRACDWHVPLAHWLERWGDALQGGVLSPIQPMIDPIFGGRSELEVLAILADTAPDPLTIVQESFAAAAPDADWREHLNRGATEVATVETPAPRLEDEAPGREPATEGYEICFAASASVWDGRFANNAWLQETPDPVTKLTWDNAAIMGPATARAIGVENADVVTIEVDGHKLEIPAFVLPGSAPRSIQIALGYGRQAGGALASRAGVDAYGLRTARSPGFVTGATVTATGRSHPLATTQQHWSIDTHEVVGDAVRDRKLVRSVDKSEFDAAPQVIAEMDLPGPPLQNISESPDFGGEHQWGMTIDLGRCLGCNGCTVACQAENNVPVVGKDEVLRGREMSWIRIDRYFEGDPEGDVSVMQQPMLCQHCENAPCEVVCPVNATVHDADGLNTMTYNRCVGTRYCANNCPYKVRRFNYYDYNKNTLRESESDFDGDPTPDPTAGLSQPQALQPPLSELVALSKNPDVTVRMRGVMEKCTFCVQRIQAAKIERKVEAGQSPPEKVADGTLMTACQQACPTEAIVFGDISDPESRVSKLRAQERSYGVLAHLNVRPRVSYLGKIRNPNPDLER